MSVIHMLLVVEVRSLSCRDSDLFFAQAGRALCNTGRLSAALAGDEGLDEDPRGFRDHHKAGGAGLLASGEHALECGERGRGARVVEPGGALEERVGIEAVHVEGRARQEEVGEGGEGLRAAVFGGAARPADGLAQVDPAAPACPVVDAEAVLRLDDARKCGFGEPSGGFLGVGASPASALVKAGEFVLGRAFSYQYSSCSGSPP